MRALIPDPRVLERGFHDVTIVDMGDSPEPSVSLDDLSLLRLQWPVTVLRSMVWLQQDLDTMHAAAKKRFRYLRPGDCSYCGKWIKCDMWLHIIWIWASCGGARCPGAQCGRARHMTVWTTSGGHTMCRRISSRLVWRSFSRHGLSGAKFRWMPSNPAIRVCPLTSCCSATLIFRWCITTESFSGGCRIVHFGMTTSLACGCLCHKQRPWRSVIWRLRFRPARFQHAMLAPLRWSRSRPGRQDVPIAICGLLAS